MSLCHKNLSVLQVSSPGCEHFSPVSLAAASSTEPSHSPTPLATQTPTMVLLTPHPALAQRGWACGIFPLVFLQFARPSV